MRYELSNDEWIVIKLMLPNKPRGVPRVNDRRVLNGIFWVLRSGAPWRDLPANFGPYTICYNRFVRWRRAGVWAKLMSALADAHDAAVQMIDTSIVRVHQHGACITRNRRQSMGRSRGGLTSKIHALVDTNGLPVRLALTAGEAHDNRLAGKLLSRLRSGAMLLADRGYDADWIRTLAAEKGDGRQKTGRAALGTVTRRTERLVAAYLTEAYGDAERLPDVILFRNRSGNSYREDTLGDDFAAIREAVFPGDTRKLMNMRRRGVVEAIAGGVTALGLASKLANSIDRSNHLHKTYAPSDLEAVRNVDDARIAGRRKMRAANEGGAKVSNQQPRQVSKGGSENG